jgi:hypothetical protein
MVVSINKARQHHLSAAAEDRDPRVFRDQLGGGADFGDDPVALEDRTVFDLMPMAAVGGLGDDGAGADDAGGHVFSPKLAVAPATATV